MITLRRSEERGHANYGWLDTHYTFSFAEYVDPRHMGYSALRVINQDLVEVGGGFPTHGHRDMEIITYVLAGALEHRDSLDNRGVLRAGEVQVMSAGRGVTHSEANAGDEPLELLQIWIHPREYGREPRWEQRPYPPVERKGRFATLVSPDGRDDSLVIDQDALLLGGAFAAGQSLTQPLNPERRYWLHVARGAVRVGEHELKKGDGAAFDVEDSLELQSLEETELLLFDLPSDGEDH